MALTRLDGHLIRHYITPGREKASMHKLSSSCFNKVKLKKKENEELTVKVNAIYAIA